jgi:hypothetical protein
MRKTFHFPQNELLTIASLIAMDSSFGNLLPATKQKVPARLEVVYLSGCFKEAQNIKRWLDTASGELYMQADSVTRCNGGFTIAAIQQGCAVYSNCSGDKVRIMKHNNMPKAKEFLDVEYTRGNWKGVFKLDVVSGVLYAKDCVQIQGSGYKLQFDGTYVGFNGHAVVPIGKTKEVKPKVVPTVTTFEVVGLEFRSQAQAEQRAKEHAINNPGFNVQVKRITTEVLGNYMVEEKQVTTKVKSWE